jgi:hypothetical protein
VRRSGQVEVHCAQLVSALGERAAAVGRAASRGREKLLVAQSFGGWSKVVWMQLALSSLR